MLEKIFGKKDEFDSTFKQLNKVVTRLSAAKDNCNKARVEGDYQSAEDYLNEIIELYDECVAISLQYLDFFISRTDPQQGLEELEYLREIIESTETFFESSVYNDVKAQNFLSLEGFNAYFLLGLEKYRRALKSCEIILQADNSRDEIWVMKGLSLMRLGNNDEALNAFETAIDLNWHNTFAWSGIGQIHQSKEHFSDAFEAFETALEIDDSNEDAITGRAEVLSQLDSGSNFSSHEKSSKMSTTSDPQKKNHQQTSEQNSDNKGSAGSEEKKVFRRPAPLKKEDTKSKGFESVAGMIEIKNDLTKDIIEPLRRREEAKKFGVSIPNGFLFFGPPGCGKTFIVRKLAEEIGYNYKEFSASDVGSKWAHETSGNIAKIFEDAKNCAPTILFFDEIEALVPKRDSLGSEQWKQEEINEFLTQMNNASEHDILVIGATNKPDLIDEAILRSGRMDKRIYIRPPDLDARKELFAKQLDGRAISKDIDTAELGRMTENFASSDITLIVNNAARTAFSEGYDEINQDLLKDIIEKTPSSLTKSQIASYEKFKNYERK